MNIIIVRDARRKPWRVNISQRRLAAWGVGAMALVVGAVGLAGFFAGDLFGDARTRARADLTELQQQIEQQAIQIAELRTVNDRHLNALALRLGELQARSARVEALGERLTQIGQLQDGEFDFGEPPAMGGPRAEADASGFDINTELSALEQQLQRQFSELNVLERLIADRELDESLEPAGRPVRTGWIASRYGKRVDPFTGEPDNHPGLDFSGRDGSDILAVADGVVIKAGKHYQYGNMIDIDHGNGYVTRYAHNKDNLVRLGDRVRAGDVIAHMGSTGRATGTHVHFEVWYQGRRMDPMSLVKNIRG